MNELRVRHLMTNLVVTLGPEDKIPYAARRLLSNRISGAPVVEGRELVGVASEADFVKADAPAARRGSPFVAPRPTMFVLLIGGPWRELHNMTVRDVMTESVVSIGPDESVWEAASLIEPSWGTPVAGSGH